MWIAPVPLPTHLTCRRGGCIGRAARAHSGTFASIRKFYLTPIRHICVYICVASDDLGWDANERFPAPEPCRAPPFPPNPGRCHILGAAATRTLPHPGRFHILTTARFPKRVSHTPDWQAWWMHSCGLGCPPRSAAGALPCASTEFSARDLSTFFNLRVFIKE